jgi:hypothetical protein
MEKNMCSHEERYYVYLYNGVGVYFLSYMYTITTVILLDWLFIFATVGEPVQTNRIYMYTFGKPLI